MRERGLRSLRLTAFIVLYATRQLGAESQL